MNALVSAQAFAVVPAKSVRKNNSRHAGAIKPSKAVRSVVASAQGSQVCGGARKHPRVQATWTLIPHYVT